MVGTMFKSWLLCEVQTHKVNKMWVFSLKWGLKGLNVLSFWSVPISTHAQALTDTFTNHWGGSWHTSWNTSLWGTELWSHSSRGTHSSKPHNNLLLQVATLVILNRIFFFFFGMSNIGLCLVYLQRLPENIKGTMYNSFLNLSLPFYNNRNKNRL